MAKAFIHCLSPESMNNLKAKAGLLAYLNHNAFPLIKTVAYLFVVCN